jgi:hypothetical protein
MQGPPPDCRQIVIRLRYGVMGGCDRRATNSGNSAWSTYRQAVLDDSPPANRSAAVSPMGRNGGAARTPAGYRVAVSAGAARSHSRRVMRPVKMRMTVLVVAVP